MVQSILANLFTFESITHKGITCRAQRNGFWIWFSCFRFICQAIGLTLQRGVKMLPWGRGERVRFLMGNFDCAPVTLERSQSLISNCAVVEKTGTRCINRSNWRGKDEVFSKLTRRGEKWTFLLYVERENQAADSNFGEKTASRHGSFEMVMSSLDFVLWRLRQKPQNPPKTMK